jgi:phosphoribosylpyrophosphate synthetase
VLATAAIDSIVVTDTIAVDRMDLGAKVSVVSVANLVARAIFALHADQPMSEVRSALG